MSSKYRQVKDGGETRKTAGKRRQRAMHSGFAANAARDNMRHTAE